MLVFLRGSIYKMCIFIWWYKVDSLLMASTTEDKKGLPVYWQPFAILNMLKYHLMHRILHGREQVFTIWAATWENRSSGFLARSDTNCWSVQLQKRARCLKFQVQEEEELYYPSSENKGTDQLHSYCEAALRLCFNVFTYAIILFSHDVAHLVNGKLLHIGWTECLVSHEHSSNIWLMI